MPEKYRPSNGTEWAHFEEKFCDQCEKDRKYREAFEKNKPIQNSDYGCQILACALVYDLSEPEYPKEWVYDMKNIPCCTAFEPYKTKEQKKRESFLDKQKKMEQAGQLRLF